MTHQDINPDDGKALKRFEPISRARLDEALGAAHGAGSRQVTA